MPGLEAGRLSLGPHHRFHADTQLLDTSRPHGGDDSVERLPGAVALDPKSFLVLEFPVVHLKADRRPPVEFGLVFEDVPQIESDRRLSIFRPATANFLYLRAWNGRARTEAGCLPSPSDENPQAMRRAPRDSRSIPSVENTDGCDALLMYSVPAARLPPRWHLDRARLYLEPGPEMQSSGVKPLIAAIPDVRAAHRRHQIEIAHQDVTGQTASIPAPAIAITCWYELGRLPVSPRPCVFTRPRPRASVCIDRLQVSRRQP